jgi:hypothetical protein
MLKTKRQKIIDALVTVFKQIDGTENVWNSNLFNNVYSKMIFWDEINDYPTVSVVSGGETREYLPGDFKWGYLTVNIRIYVNCEDPKTELEGIFSDIEKALDANNTLTVNGNHLCTDIRILSISDDEGLLAPVGVGEMVLQIQYTV